MKTSTDLIESVRRGAERARRASAAAGRRCAA